MRFVQCCQIDPICRTITSLGTFDTSSSKYSCSGAPPKICKPSEWIHIFYFIDDTILLFHFVAFQFINQCLKFAMNLNTPNVNWDILMNRKRLAEIEPKWTRHGNLISRPKNCFLVYRLEMATPLTDTGLLKDNPSISKVVEEMWRREPESVKAYYPKKKKKSTNSSKSRLFLALLDKSWNFFFPSNLFHRSIGTQTTSISLRRRILSTSRWEKK